MTLAYRMFGFTKDIADRSEQYNDVFNCILTHEGALGTNILELMAFLIWLVLLQPIHNHGYFNHFSYNQVLFPSSAQPPQRALASDIRDHSGRQFSRYNLFQQPTNKRLRVLKSRRYRGNLQCFVRWKGLGQHEDSWQPADNLENAPEGMVSRNEKWKTYQPIYLR